MDDALVDQWIANERSGRRCCRMRVIVKLQIDPTALTMAFHAWAGRRTRRRDEVRPTEPRQQTTVRVEPRVLALLEDGVLGRQRPAGWLIAISRRLHIGL